MIEQTINELNIDTQSGLHPMNESTRKLLFDPSLMIIGTEQIMEKYNKSSNNEQHKEWFISRSNIKKDLFNKSLDTRCNRDINTKYIEDVVNVFNSIPPLLSFSKSKPTIPEFDEILIEPTDTSELKKFIRKVNYEMLGYHCNHKVMNEQCDQVFKHITDLYNSKEYVEYEEFIDKLSKLIYHIREKDSYDKDFHGGEIHHIPLNHEIKHIIDNVIKMNGSITAYNAKTNPECSKCKAAVRKYEYSLREVDRMRSEIKQLHKELSKPSESKYDINEFLMKNYPTIDKVPLKVVKERYKQEFNINLKYSELTEKIESTNLFKVTNIHNIKYMNRL